MQANAALNLGTSLGTIAIILSPLSKKSRGDFRKDFDRSYARYYTAQPEATPEASANTKSVPSKSMTEINREQVEELWAKAKAGDGLLATLPRRWSEINKELLRYVSKPNDPEALRLMDEQDAIRVEIETLKGADRIREVVIVGGGIAGLSGAINASLDGLDTLLLEQRHPVGVQTKALSLPEQFPESRTETPARELIWRQYIQARRAGAQIRLGARVVKTDQDPETEFWTLRLSNGEKVQSVAVIGAAGAPAAREADDRGYSDSWDWTVGNDEAREFEKRRDTDDARIRYRLRQIEAGEWQWPALRQSSAEKYPTDGVFARGDDWEDDDRSLSKMASCRETGC